MRRQVAIKEQWHIIVIIVIVIVLSVTSWLEFASIVYHHFGKEENSELTDTFDNKVSKVEQIPSAEQTSGGKLSALCKAVDTITDKIDREWYVYKQPSLSKIDSLITYFGIGEISSVQVVEGSDKWLFYKTKTDGDPIADYEGTNEYTEPEMERMAQSALFAQNELENRGIKFALLVPPNKENVYWENMPDIYRHVDESRTDKLIKYLLQNGVNAVSPKKELLDNHLSLQLYYYYDTHWNQLGAYIGVRDTLSSWNISMPELSKRTISSKKLKEEYHYCAKSELAAIAGLRSILSDDIEYEVDGTGLMDWKRFELDHASKEISHFFNEKAVNSNSVFLVGDSFRAAMVPALREQFADVYVVHWSYYSSDMLDTINPDYLIAEYIERNSSAIGLMRSLVE